MRYNYFVIGEEGVECSGRVWSKGLVKSHWELQLLIGHQVEAWQRRSGRALLPVTIVVVAKSPLTVMVWHGKDPEFNVASMELLSSMMGSFPSELRPYIQKHLKNEEGRLRLLEEQKALEVKARRAFLFQQTGVVFPVPPALSPHSLEALDWARLRDGYYDDPEWGGDY